MNGWNRSSFIDLLDFIDGSRYFLCCVCQLSLRNDNNIAKHRFHGVVCRQTSRWMDQLNMLGLANQVCKPNKNERMRFKNKFKRLNG